MDYGTVVNLIHFALFMVSVWVGFFYASWRVPALSLSLMTMFYISINNYFDYGSAPYWISFVYVYGDLIFGGLLGIYALSMSNDEEEKIGCWIVVFTTSLFVILNACEYIFSYSDNSSTLKTIFFDNYNVWFITLSLLQIISIGLPGVLGGIHHINDNCSYDGNFSGQNIGENGEA